MLEIDPSQLGTLDMGGYWVPYLNLQDLDFVPTRITMARDEYDFKKSAPTLGHGAVLPDELRAARDAGKKTVIVERGDRYYLFVA
jgi:hypothetical protein